MVRKANTLHPLAYAAICGVATLVALVIGYALLSYSRLGIGEASEKRIYYVLLIVLGMAGCALVFGAMKATASFRGQRFGAALELGGPVVGLFLLPIIGFWLTQPQSEFDLTVNLGGLHPSDDIPKSISMVVDVEGRREVLQFTPRGQAVVRALPYRLRGKEATFQFASETYKIEATSLTFPMIEPFVFAIKLNRVSDAELRRREQKADLLKKFDRVIRDIDESVMQREGTLIPAFQDFISNPSPQGWSMVRFAANEALEQIRVGMQHAREYDSALALTTDELLRLVSSTQSNVANRTFSAAVQSWGGKGGTLSGLPIAMPSSQEAQVWLADLMHHYRRLQQELRNFRMQLAART